MRPFLYGLVLSPRALRVGLLLFNQRVVLRGSLSIVHLLDRIVRAFALRARCRDNIARQWLLFVVRFRPLSLACEKMVVVMLGSCVVQVVQRHDFEIGAACHLVETDGLFSLLLEEVLGATLERGFEPGDRTDRLNIVLVLLA